MKDGGVFRPFGGAEIGVFTCGFLVHASSLLPLLTFIGSARFQLRHNWFWGLRLVPIIIKVFFIHIINPIYQTLTVHLIRRKKLHSPIYHVILVISPCNANNEIIH